MYFDSARSLSGVSCALGYRRQTAVPGAPDSLARSQRCLCWLGRRTCERSSLRKGVTGKVHLASRRAVGRDPYLLRCPCGVVLIAWKCSERSVSADRGAFGGARSHRRMRLHGRPAPRCAAVVALALEAWGFRSPSIHPTPKAHPQQHKRSEKHAQAAERCQDTALRTSARRR